MELVKRTEHLEVFDSGIFYPFGGGGARRRLYVGFVADVEAYDEDIEPKRWPVVTALFTLWPESSNKGGDFLEWLETSRYTGDTDTELDPQIIRDEFMWALKELHPEAVVASEPEEQEAEDGSLYFLDTLDGELVDR